MGRRRRRSSPIFTHQRHEGAFLAWFYVAIPVGSALGYAFGGKIADLLGWRWAFYLVVPPGLFLAALLFFYARTASDNCPWRSRIRPTLRDYHNLFRIRSYVLNTAAMTVMTFRHWWLFRLDA